MSDDDRQPTRRRRARRPAGPAGDAATEPAAGVFVVGTPPPEPDPGASDASTADSSAAPRERTVAPSGSRRRVSPRIVVWTAAVAAVLLVVAGVTTTVFFAVRTDDIKAHEARCAQYSGFARQMIVNLTSLSPDTIDQAISTFQRSTSGRALADVQQTMENTAGLIKQDKVTTRGTVLSDAVSACDSDSGSVLVVSGWQLRNPSAKEDVVQTFRWRVDVTDINGQLKATKIQWVT